MPDSERLLPGRLIADRYRVGEVVGRGAMGIVYAAEHVRVGRPVALKVLTRAWSNKASVRDRFEAEARAASAAGHPNIIQVFDVGELPDQRLYSVMEFIEGPTLYKLLWAEHPLALTRACRLIRDAAFGVRAAHARGVIHRDLKLENVMVQVLPEGEVVKVLDFGIAAGVITRKRSTVAGMALGTPEYMAPEQVDGAEPTVRFDIYALGVMLFELLTKRLPIADENPLKLMALKGHLPAPRIVEFRPEVPAALDQLIADCLEIDPSRRPASCELFLDRLEPILAALESAPAPTTTLVADPSTPPPRPSRLTRSYAEMRGISADEGAAVRVAGQTRGWASEPLLWLGAGLALSAALSIGLLMVGQRGRNAELVEAEADPRRLPEEPAADEAAAGEQGRDEPSADEPTPSEDRPPPQAPSIEPGATPATHAPEADSPAKPRAREHETPRCKAVRERGLDSRQAHDWPAVLDAAQQRECWAHARERKKLETQAYMELGRFDDCLRAGKHVNDTEVKKWVTLCSKRLAG
ncbi:Serine/threonine-protein kinase PrkC [Enhygromyxa salina]|uniref:Serine/threonine-protein kinase PrkC n=1 Tax=Enhygromyxa salina TaxID=215803 RepID=A0A2S9XEZ2_9BACT|nr:serine/threonine-protein kinase [Enhygromyxa salina]PRP91434.1 Serine/threonine-protein kinase PrkC [Enhygromyxa salina]